MEEKRINIAGFAIENDELFCCAVEGVNKGGETEPERCFEYLNSTKIEKIALPETLSEASLQKAIGNFIRRFPEIRFDSIALSTYGAIDVLNSTLAATPSDNPTVLNPRNFDFQRALKPVLGDIPVIVDNDSTAAAMGEYLWGAGKDHRSADLRAFAYIWVSRGTNSGIVIDGEVIGGSLRPEAGHLIPKRYEIDGVIDPYHGSCTAHGGCVTGLSGLRSFYERTTTHQLSVSQALDISGYYIAQLCAAVTLVVAPVRLVIGGMQMRSEHSQELFDAIRKHYPAMVSSFPLYEANPDTFLIPAKLGIRASLYGMVEIARRRLAARYPLRETHDTQARKPVHSL